MDESTLTPFERELARECEMVGLGRERALRQALLAQDRQSESLTDYGRRLIDTGLEPFVKALTQFLEHKGRGPKPQTIPILSQLGPHEVGVIVLSAVVDGLSHVNDDDVAKLTDTAHTVGKRVEDELQCRAFAVHDRAFWSRLQKRLAHYHGQKREGILKSALAERNKGRKLKRRHLAEEWTPKLRVMVGLQCLDLLLHAAPGLFERVTIGRGKAKYDAIKPTASTLDWIKAFIDRAGIIAPVFLPMLIPPRPWTNPFDGGYYLSATALRPLHMVKVWGARGRAYLANLNTQRNSLQFVYGAINAVQDTAWKINERVLDVMCAAWENEIAIGQIPTQDPMKGEDHSVGGRRLTAHRLIQLAKELRNSEALYFPMQLDFRGRMYTVPSTLNYQSNKPARGLLTFAKGKPLGKAGFRWLRIHGANLYGQDKGSFDEREAWAIEHDAQVIQTTTDPLQHVAWWGAADKGANAWQFLAWCFEYAGALTCGVEPEKYVSRLPISVDGSCNGLQHYSALLRDPKGGAAVNLGPTALPEDIYQHVADTVKARIKQDAKRNKPYAKTWLQWGFDRKATKRAVMIRPYSGTMPTARQYLVKEYMQPRLDCPWKGKRLFFASNYFMLHVWRAIDESAPKAKAAMEWFRKAAFALSKAGRPVQWITPAGFPVVLAKYKQDSYQIETQFNGRRFAPRLNRENAKEGRLDARQQADSLAPGFIHSMDAACLMLTVCQAVHEGIGSFAMVHDSFGTHAADMEGLNEALRQAFFDCYMENQLEQFAKTNDLPATLIDLMPKAGTLTTEAVKNSLYFFA